MLRRKLELVLLLCMALSQARAATLAELTAEVRRAEQGFAATMANRDEAAFAEFLAQEAVFFGARGEIRGRAAVSEAWKAYFKDARAPFSWRPDTVAVLSSGTLGYTSGPVFDPQGKRIGTFNTTWRLEKDGRWRVIFDNGCPSCDCGR